MNETSESNDRESLGPKINQAIHYKVCEERSHR